MEENREITNAEIGDYYEPPATSMGITMLASEISEPVLNRNKPWREVIRRKIAYGRGDYEDFSGAESGD